MSGQKSERRELDAYYTPVRLARRAVETIPLMSGDLVLEPSAGEGAFLTALSEGSVRGVRLAAMDINPDAPGLQYPGLEYAVVGDFPQTLIRKSQQPDWVVGNPPYGEAEEHIRRALRIAKKGVAFLLRLAFLESQKREEFWEAHPCRQVHVLTQRPSFTGGSTDTAAYGWFIWKHGSSEPTTIHFMRGSWR